MAVSLEVTTDWNMRPVPVRKKRHFRESNSGKYELAKSMVRPLRSRTYFRSGRTSLTLASRKARSSAL